MRLFVCIKQVPDTEAKITIKSDSSGIDTSNIKWIMNPYDEFAVEEALKLKTFKPEATVTVVSLGPKQRVVDSLRTALAMGADDAILIDAPEDLDSFSTAQALAAAIKAEGPFDLIFTGKLAIDDNAAAVSQLVAGFLGIPHSTVISKFTDGDAQIEIERDTEGGSKEVVELHKPALIGCNKGLNLPRYASLPGIMKAKKKTVKEHTFDSLNLGSPDIKVTYTDFQLPPASPAIQMIEGDSAHQASELVRLLREESKVI